MHNWIVVIRSVKDTTSRGEILRANMTEKVAKAWAAVYLAHQRQEMARGADRECGSWKEVNCWAMEESEY